MEVLCVVTMRDVAEASGVSVATVSRVLSGRIPVGDDKRRAVEDACSELGYRQDALAAALKSGSSSSVGMVIPDIRNPFFPAVIHSVEHELAVAGIDMLFCDAENDIAAEKLRIDSMLRRRVDALLICPVDSRASARALRSATRHTRVLQFERTAIEGVDYVGVDQAAGMKQVVTHLVGLGVSDAMFVGLQPEISSIAERAGAFEQSCESAGLTMRPTVPLPQHDVASGRGYTRRLLASGKLPEAVVCANDQVALGVLAELRAAGVGCPADVVVVGYDDVPAAELLGLTTVHQPLRELGREAARLLQHPSDAARHVCLAPNLVVRGSTDASVGDLWASELAI
jgi:LacI family transcriptional regulator